MLPEFLLFAKAGAGKDTLAQMLIDGHGAVALAMADSMKRLAEYIFDFDENQLWGPSSARNAPDFRYNWQNVGEEKAMYAWAQAKDRLFTRWVDDWVAEVMPDHLPRVGAALADLRTNWWQTVNEMAAKNGFLAPRLPLQTLGTEWGRNWDDKMWIRGAQRAQRRLIGGGWAYSRKTGLYEKPGQMYQMALVTDGRFPNEPVEFRAGGATVIHIIDPNDKPNESIEAAGVKGHASEKFQDLVPGWWSDITIYNDKTRGLAALRHQVDEMMYMISNSDTRF